LLLGNMLSDLVVSASSFVGFVCLMNRNRDQNNPDGRFLKFDHFLSFKDQKFSRMPKNICNNAKKVN